MSGVERYPLRVPDDWERSLPGFSAWMTRLLRDVLSKGDVRNAIGSGGISISGSSSTVATLSNEGFGPAQVFSPRVPAPPADAVIGEVRAFVRHQPAPVDYADAQAILAQRVFGG